MSVAFPQKPRRRPRQREGGKEAMGENAVAAAAASLHLAIRAGGEEKQICRNRLLCSAEMGVGMMG